MCFVSIRSKSQCRLLCPEGDSPSLELVLDVLGLEVFDPLDVVSLLDAAVALEGDIFHAVSVVSLNYFICVPIQGLQGPCRLEAL